MSEIFPSRENDARWPEGDSLAREAHGRLLRHGTKEGARGGTMGSPTMNEWGYSCRLVDLVGKLLP
jgi:hypothetical protein